MIKMSASFSKVVLILHFVALALWLGGVVSGLPMLYKADISQYDSARSVYLSLRDLAWNVIGWGGMGGLLTGVALAIFTPWGLFKHRWVTAKLLLVVALVLFGIFYNEHRILENIRLLDRLHEGAMLDPQFIRNHDTLKTGLIISVTGFVLVIAIAVFKPALRKKALLSSPNEI